MKKESHILVDLDGTLAYYDHFVDDYHIGKPIPKMVEKVKTWLNEGKNVKIFTARVSNVFPDRDIESITKFIQDWVEIHIGKRLEVTCIKDSLAVEIYDDRAITIVKNTGMTLEEYNKNQDNYGKFS